MGQNRARIGAYPRPLCKPSIQSSDVCSEANKKDDVRNSMRANATGAVRAFSVTQVSA